MFTIRDTLTVYSLWVNSLDETFKILNTTDYHEEISNPSDVELSPEMMTVFVYWQSLRGARSAPIWREFDFIALPPHLIPWCAVVDVSYDPMEFTYRFFGSSRVRIQREDYTKHRVSEVKPDYLAKKVAGDYVELVEAFEPKFFRTTRQSTVNSARKLQYHFIRMPFSNDGARVDQILSFGYFEESQIKEMHEFFDHEF